MEIVKISEKNKLKIKFRRELGHWLRGSSTCYAMQGADFKSPASIHARQVCSCTGTLMLGRCGHAPVISYLAAESETPPNNLTSSTSYMGRF